MKKTAWILLILFVNASVDAQNGTDILKSAHKKYYQGPCKIYTFSQKNTHYKNDSISGHSEWHEAIEFPDKFRIDFGDRKSGNFVIFKNDSVFNYKKGNLISTRADSSTLLLLLGGMFYRKPDDVFARIRAANYNTKVLSVQKWNGQDTYVIGAKEKDLRSNQVWIDKKTLRVMRIIEKMNEEDTMDMRFEAHQDWCKGYVETKVSFRRNGVLEQVEEYFDIKVADKFPE
ncbi:hypothetical protein CNR22_12590 [Sphingobacteriaceae bacterium]|nr:hypothetical protein CNR22_12590 [Sphingobacteriaceae bacterium]